MTRVVCSRRGRLPVAARTRPRPAEPTRRRVDAPARAAGAAAAGVLFWDPSLGRPDARVVRALLDGTGDVWHAGLRLGTGGLPRMLDFVTPTWPLNRDPDPGIEATSWRVSLRACLARTSVLRAIGDLDPGFRSLAAAALEWGHRLLERGAFVRHVPALVPGRRSRPAPCRSRRAAFVLGTVRRQVGTVGWSRGKLARRHRTAPASRRPVARARRGRTPGVPSFHSHGRDFAARPPTVSVIVPTWDRYPYLRVLPNSSARRRCRRPHQGGRRRPVAAGAAQTDLSTEFRDYR